MGKITEIPSNELPPSYDQSESHAGPSKYDDLRQQIDNLHFEDEERRDSKVSQEEEETETANSHPVTKNADVASDDTQKIDVSSNPENHTGHKHHHYGRKIADKLTHTTHEERVKARAERAAAYQRAYENAPAYGYGYPYGYGLGGFGYGGFGYGYGGFGLGNQLLFDTALLGGGFGGGLFI